MRKINFLHGACLSACFMITMNSCVQDEFTPGTSNTTPRAAINYSSWQLQEPNGATISSSSLANGYSDQYFYKASDGSQVFYAPRTGTTTPNSNYTRTELRQNNNWSLSGTHTLTATVKVVSSPGTVCVGQIHIGTGSPASTKPTCELYYRTSGEILIGVENAPSGGQTLHSITTVPMGTKWSYTIKTSGSTLTVTANGKTVSYGLNSAFKNYTHYFKAGDYNQSTGSGASKVQFYSISIVN
jgi:hypothetical protein